MPKKNAKRVSSRKISPSETISSVNTDTISNSEKIAEPLSTPIVDENVSLKIDEVEKKEESEPQEQSNTRLYILGAVIVGIVLIAVVILFVLFSSQLEQEKNKEAKIGVPPMPTMALKRALVRDDWSFEVLNGSGVAGAAKKAADKLEALGYKVINMGNADASNYKESKIYVTAEMIGKEDLLIADLKNDFDIASVSGEFSSLSTASARLIVGKSP